MQDAPAIGPRVIVLMGVSGCGKSTTGQRLAKRLGWPFRDADSFHPEANIAKMSRGAPLEDADRWPWLAAIAQWIDERREAGAPGIVSCSALKRAYRACIIGERSRVDLVYLKGSMQLISERLARRKGHFMPASLLESQFAALEEPQTGERPIVISVVMSPPRVVGAIIEALALRAAAAGA